MNIEQRKKISYTAGVSSIIVNFFLFLIKYWAGITAHSVSIIADSWHTLSDSISSIIVLAGAKVSSKPADKNHPFGHGRVELIASIFIGALLAFVSFNFLVESIEKLKIHEPANYTSFTMIVTIISILVKEGLAQLSFFLGKKIQSKPIIADGWHHRSDAFSSIIILIGIFLGPYFWWIDGILGIIVSLFIAKTALMISQEAISPIIGETPSDEIIVHINKIAVKLYQKDLKLHHFHIHDYINTKEMTFHLKLPSQMTIKESHSIVTQMESQIKEELNIIATIHIEPLE